MRKNKPYIGMLMMLACALLWSLNGLSIKLVPWGAMALAGWRGLAAALALFAAMRLLKYPVRLKPRTLLIGLCVCATGLMYIVANRLTTAANAIVLQYTSPVWMMALGMVFFGRRYRPLDYGAVVFTVAGIALFFFGELTPGGITGNILAIADGCTLALVYLLVGESDEPHRLSGILLGLVLTALVGILLSLADPPSVTPASAALVAAMGVFQLGLPYALYSVAINYCPPLGCVLIGSAEIVLNPVWVWLAVGEAPDVFALAGGAVILATVTLWCALGGAKLKEGLPLS
ncbi:MAG: EamA-like transporter family protein [Firmicutes bacterium ADurb.Bin248]|nr:MAG: EamA-like transporter family protein [Firmicutes bacterium ADurb.Bin248]HOG01411.1 DMT family transporter [Clostridia bacterium]HPK15845.1 DMT family transporter [Clostridia bacterium]